MRPVRFIVLASVLAFLFAVPSVTDAHTTHHTKKHHAACTQSQIRHEPMVCVARLHHWTESVVQDEWDILYHESTSYRGHVNLYAVNGSCYGSGQLQGSSAVEVYESYGGDYYTVYGQLKADANYVDGRYGSPVGGENHELEFGWY